MNPIITEMMLRERREDMLKEAEQIRLVALYEANNPTKKAKILIALGDFLIQTGEKIKQRYSPKVALAADSCGGI